MFFVFVPAIPQDPNYHSFADQSLMLGIPNFWNVLSNLPFVIVGLLGFKELAKEKHQHIAERFAWKVLFGGVFLAGFGSAYYHWNPANGTLLWDRLPMSIGFMGFFAVVLGERFGEKVCHKFLWPLVFLGMASVLYWYFTEAQGSGDLRLYALVQFLSIILISIFVNIYPSQYSHGHYTYGTIGFYLLAKVFEHFDGQIHQGLGQMMSGHSLKHVIAAVGCYCLVLMLQVRSPIAGR